MSTVTTQRPPEQVQGKAYEPFFGLREAPFGLAPDTRFLFASASHSSALAQVGYALERREPLVVITGEIGTGKTLLCRTVLQQLRRKTFLSVINDPLLERDDLLKQLLEDFGVISKDRTKLTEASRHDLVRTLHEFLRSLAPIQAHAVVPAMPAGCRTAAPDRCGTGGIRSDDGRSGRSVRDMPRILRPGPSRPDRSGGFRCHPRPPLPAVSRGDRDVPG